ncbi:MAG: tetratricopeptide repeat protein, partial [Bacteroidales bacterium]|nr:tetratricopeptide repeat protein [Bacteroidales bacterium]
MSVCYINIGIIYSNQKNYEKSLEYYQKSLEISKKINDKYGIATCYNNIGGIYKAQNKVKQAIEFYQKSLKIHEELGDKNGLASCYNNIGGSYKYKGNYEKALEYYQKSLKIKEEINDKNGIALVYGNIADLYITITDSTKLNEKQKKEYLLKAIDYATKAMILGKEIEALPKEGESYMHLMMAYKKLNNYKKAFEFAEKYIQIRDSLFSTEKTKALAEMETKYEAEKKQLQVEKLQKQKELDKKTIEAKTSENKRQQYIIFSSIAVIVLILIFSLILLKMFRDKRKANILLAKQNIEIKTQKEEIASQRDIVIKQKEHIEFYHKRQTDSINYAKRIQEAVLPISKMARSILGEHFILFKPKDIVSGDFYWTTQIDNMLIVAVADCTGHGVPGAFMSMLGISFLNEIVRKKEMTKANDVLNELRKEIINALQQKGIAGEQKDGMDIALIAINKNTLQCQFAGANNPLYLVRKAQNEPTANYELIEYKGDKMPVAIHIIMNNFTNYEFQLEQGDML